MKVASIIADQLEDLEFSKRRNYLRFAIKAHNAFNRYINCKNRRRARAHYSAFLKFSSKSFK